ncbi:MAG TPA: hypothetical protein DDW50_15505 [Firmicutes bacterium]|nr:hypothetical protein [Bacillota bacterium]
MSKHHHHHHHDCDNGCSKPEECGNPKGEGWPECLSGKSNGTFLIFLVLIILAFSCMGGGGF